VSLRRPIPTYARHLNTSHGSVLLSSRPKLRPGGVRLRGVDSASRVQTSGAIGSTRVTTTRSTTPQTTTCEVATQRKLRPRNAKSSWSRETRVHRPAVDMTADRIRYLARCECAMHAAHDASDIRQRDELGVRGIAMAVLQTLARNSLTGNLRRRWREVRCPRNPQLSLLESTTAEYKQDDSQAECCESNRARQRKTERRVGSPGRHQYGIQDQEYTGDHQQDFGSYQHHPPPVSRVRD